MLIKNRFEYPTLERTTASDGPRFYLDPTNNEPLPSVTTILSHTADKGFLTEWIARVGEKKAEEIRNEAAALGTLMHTHMECYVQGIPRPGGSNMIRRMAERMANKIIEDGMPNVNEVWGYEIPLYFPGLYAGTTDLLGVHNGEPAIMDYKNTKKMKKKEMITDYFCQGAAYALAHNAVHGTDIAKIVIFMVDRELNYKEFVVEGDEFIHYAELWIQRLQEYQRTGPKAHAADATVEVEMTVAGG